MADLFASTYEFNATPLTDAELNARVSSLNDRLKNLEAGGIVPAQIVIFFPGTVTSGYKGIIPITFNAVGLSVRLGMITSSPSVDAVIDFLKVDPADGPGDGVSFWASPTDRPTFPPSNISGVEGPFVADQQIPIVAGEKIEI